jgi:glyoxylase-like metal-dependent hydrolase (beta-lactamase superfamily II)
MSVWICTACAVEHPESDAPPAHCAICEDERQYVPQSGQAWASLDQLRAEGQRLSFDEREPGLYGISTEPRTGIGQQAKLVMTDAGNLLWDPPGFVDDAGAGRVRELGGAVAIVASHPHMYGTQVEWARALDAKVLVAEADQHWVQRPDPVIETFSGDLHILPGVTLRTIGGHFPGSIVAAWEAGADGRGVLLAGDTVYPTPGGTWVSFMRSFPNALPMSAAVVTRVAAAAMESRFDRLYGNFAWFVERDAHAVIQRSVDRYVGWISGEFDELT